MPAVSGLGAAWLTYLTARRLCLRTRALLPLAMGLTTPIMLYSVVFWVHATLMLLCAAIGYSLLRALQETERVQARWAILAGALLSLGVWFHELMFALFLALLLAFAPLIGRWALSNRIFYGVLTGPHFLEQNDLTSPFHQDMMTHLPLILQRFGTQLLGNWPLETIIETVKQSQPPFILGPKRGTFGQQFLRLR